MCIRDSGNCEYKMLFVFLTYASTPHVLGDRYYRIRDLVTRLSLIWPSLDTSYPDTEQSLIRATDIIEVALAATRGDPTILASSTEAWIEHGPELRHLNRLLVAARQAITFIDAKLRTRWLKFRGERLPIYVGIAADLQFGFIRCWREGTSAHRGVLAGLLAVAYHETR